MLKLCNKLSSILWKVQHTYILHFGQKISTDQLVVKGLNLDVKAAKVEVILKEPPQNVVAIINSDLFIINVVQGPSLQLISHAVVISQHCDLCWCCSWKIVINVASFQLRIE